MTPNILINGIDANSMPSFFATAISPSGNEAIHFMKSPALVSEKQNMLDVMKLFVHRLEREIADSKGQS